MIAIIQHHDFTVFLHVYTHNGNGLIGKPNPNHYVQVRDHRVPRRWVYLEETNLEPLKTGQLDPGIPLLHPEACVYLTCPVCIKREHPVSFLGYLEAQSTRQLQRLYKQYIPKIPRSPTDAGFIPQVQRQRAIEPPPARMMTVLENGPRTPAPLAIRPRTWSEILRGLTQIPTPTQVVDIHEAPADEENPERPAVAHTVFRRRRQ